MLMPDSKLCKVCCEKQNPDMRHQLPCLIECFPLCTVVDDVTLRKLHAHGCKCVHAIAANRVAGVSATISHPAAQRSLDLADDAESNMPPPPPLPQWRSGLPRMHITSFPGDQEVWRCSARKNRPSEAQTACVCISAAVPTR